MNEPATRLTDPDEIIREFQKRQKRVVLAAMACFILIMALGLSTQGIDLIQTAIIFGVIFLAMFLFYLWMYRCPACGVRVQQQRRGLRVPIRCGKCKALLDPR